MDAATLADRHIGTKQARAFGARNVAYDHELSLACLYREFTIAKKGELDDAEVKETEVLGRQLQEAAEKRTQCLRYHGTPPL